MRNLLTLLATSGALALAGPAQAAIGTQPYIQLDAGPSWFDTSIKGITDKFDTGWEVDGKVGTHLANTLRTELQLGYETADTNQAGVKGSVSNLNLMANGLFDLSRIGPLSPYIGAGLGAARINADIFAPPIPHYDDSQWAFAWQAMTGVNWRLTDRAAVTAGYRYFDADSKTIGGFKTDHNSNLVSVGLKLAY